ncbi:MAG TPA: hypothetical protein PLQ32_02040 [Flavihumibacter sp.]|nr:hypothetical protein [Bacteroidota bacterium]HOA36933.1 hypothetical protein [Flavihumibacter sp.]HPZ86854.1 hypothetical protein [Flavihumibacter sp.]HQD08158.1 hypothetical protein [Flavihumibacter sp.]
MNTFKNIGLVECSKSGKIFKMPSTSSLHGYNLKKVLIDGSISEGHARNLYPDAELVQEIQEITTDKDIDLVLVSAPQGYNRELLSTIMSSGKPVRIL